MAVILVMTTGARIHNRRGRVGCDEIERKGWPEMSAEIRKIAVWVERDTARDRAADIAADAQGCGPWRVSKPPFVRLFTEDLTQLMDIGAELGGLLGR